MTKSPGKIRLRRKVGRFEFCERNERNERNKSEKAGEEIPLFYFCILIEESVFMKFNVYMSVCAFQEKTETVSVEKSRWQKLRYKYFYKFRYFVTPYDFQISGEKCERVFLMDLKTKCAASKQNGIKEQFCASDGIASGKVCVHETGIWI